MDGDAVTVTRSSPVDEPVLRRLKRELERRYGDRLERVLLFGSRARGDARPDSDWDIAVFLRGYEGNAEERRDLALLGYEFMLETGFDLSLKPFAPEELAERTPLMHEIRREGVPL